MRPKKNILVVDDNEQALSCRRFLLETRGYRVHCALNAADAMELFTLRSLGMPDQAPAGLDLVICDVVMKEVDGATLTRTMRSVNPDVPLMLISGSITQVEHCADVFLGKGQKSTAEVLEHVRRLVVSKRGPKKKRPVSCAPVPDAAPASETGAQKAEAAA